MTGRTGQEGEYEESLLSFCHPFVIPTFCYPFLVFDSLLYRVCNEKPILEANKLRQFSEMANNAKFAGFFAK